MQILGQNKLSTLATSENVK